MCSMQCTKLPLLLNREGDDMIAKRMHALTKMPNMLKQKVEDNGWDSRVKSQWKKLMRRQK